MEKLTMKYVKKTYDVSEWQRRKIYIFRDLLSGTEYELNANKVTETFMTFYGIPVDIEFCGSRIFSLSGGNKRVYFAGGNKIMEVDLLTGVETHCNKSFYIVPRANKKNNP